MPTALLSVVIPTLNAAKTLPTTMASLGGREGLDLVVSDGGSADGTVTLAENSGARAIIGGKGRGPQLAHGAEAAAGEALLFLHADSRLPAGWRIEAERFLASEASETGAAAFRLSFDEDSPGARRVARMANWRSRVFGLPYGDQGLLISRSVYERVGGYRPLPLMEDVDLVRRIGRWRMVLLDGTLTTSADRYRRGGWIGRPARNLTLLSLYLLGVPPRHLVKLYG